jgi:endonuclease/exonuclease/phosphatase family metal-dependent hydrolase
VFKLVYTADTQHWLAGFFMMTYPVVFLGNLFFFFSYVFIRPFKSLLSLACLLMLSYKILPRTIKVVPPDIKPKQAFTFSVLSYNLMYGNYRGFKTGKDSVTSQSQKAFLDTLSSDIICLQEFYNDPKINSFNLSKALHKTRPQKAYIKKNPNHENGKGAVGLAIFSRFKIINQKEIYWPPNNNGLLSADLVIDDDTLRVINFQLKSMGIRVGKILKSDNKIDREATRNIFLQLKDGFTGRSVQVQEFNKFISESPYPVLLAGDLNELPYGYAYGQLRKNLKNSFEESGFGFGFTYRKILSFLRIDSQFYDSKKIENISFETLNVPYSDHNPIKGWYNLKH